MILVVLLDLVFSSIQRYQFIGKFWPFTYEESKLDLMLRSGGGWELMGI